MVNVSRVDSPVLGKDILHTEAQHNSSQSMNVNIFMAQIDALQYASLSTMFTHAP